jgi:hypothetical protein
MGNSPMTIGLQVKNPKGSGGRGRGEGHHVAGSILYGKVYLSITEHEETATSIRLKVIGKENIVIHHTTTEEERSSDSNDGRRRSSTSTRDHYEQSTHDIWNVDHPLKVFPNGKIPRGQYEFPFALQLPESLPSTMSSEWYVSNTIHRVDNDNDKRRYIFTNLYSCDVIISSLSFLSLKNKKS